MKLPLRSLCAAFALASIGLSRLCAFEFAQAESDLRPDPAVRYGQLSNGLSYVILPNREPEDRASLRLVVRAGSLNESDSERGYAHLLARVAFRGSDRYPPGTMPITLKRWGMTGAAEDASLTDFERSTYSIELPDTRASTLKEGCRLLADIGGHLSLRDDQIDAERAALQEAVRESQTGGGLEQATELKFTLPDSLIPRRMPAGTVEALGSARHEQLAAFYDAWYRPGRMVVVAVGDFDASTIEDIIHDAFGDLRDRGPARPEPRLGDIAIASGLRTLFVPQPGARGVRISLQTITPYYHEADSAERRQGILRRGLAFAMLNRRLAAIAGRQGAPFLSATADVGEQFDFVHNAALQVISSPDRWKEALAAGEQELRRALTYGFQLPELQEVADGLRRQLQNAADTAGGRPSSRLADAVVRSIVQGQVFTTPAQNLAIYGAALSAVTPEDCAAALRNAWAAKGTCVVVTGGIDLKDPDAEVAAAYRASQAVAVQPPAKVVRAVFPYGSFGTPGVVASRRSIADLGVTEVVFQNGVRLNLKATKFEPGKIYVNVRVGGGGLTEPADAEPGLARFTEGVFRAAGLGRLSVPEIRETLQGHAVGFQFHVGDDAFNFAGATDRTDFPLELRLITAYIADPGYRADALERAHRAIPVMYRNLYETPDAILETKAARIMANGDPRFGLPAEGELMARNLDEMRRWLAPQFSRGPIEVAMVGDLDVDAAIQAVAATLGALPQRGTKPAYEGERTVSYPEKAVSKAYPISADAKWGCVLVIWPTTDGRDTRVAHRLGILAEILGNRLRAKMRDEPGAPVVVARSAPSSAYAGFGMLIVDASANQANAVEKTHMIIGVAAEMQRNGVLDDEVDRAKQAALSAVEDSVRTNDYWLNSVLGDAQEEPQRLDWARTRAQDINSVTAAEISDLAAHYLEHSRASRFVALPEQAGP
jgi:zinc protease